MTQQAFSSVKIVGGLLPADVIGRIYAGDRDVPGISPQTYGLEPSESVRRQASRVWQYLLEKWQEYKSRLEESPEAASARVTRERWLHILLRELGFGRLSAEGGIELGGRNYPVSHRFNDVPIHLLGWRTDLDHRTHQVTARPPQSMLQELLNRSDDYLWALLSNGSVLRMLRDSTVLAGQAYIEFDLEAIFDGEIFSDFVCLYLLCHASRFAPAEGGGPSSCYLEQWRAFAAEAGQRALAQLRRGVEEAISHLGTGFLAHPDNQHLRSRLDPRSGELRLEDFNRSLLRLVYRLLFWFVAEDRDVLLDPGPDKPDTETAQRLRLARDRYQAYFSSARLRKLARARRGDRHGDVWDSVQVVFDALGGEGGLPQLALPGIGGIFETELPHGSPLPLDEPLAGARLSNQALLSAVRALSIVTPKGGGARRPVDFGNLGAEELGSVYEGLLEYVPRYEPETRVYTLETLPGHERKETGSYYTPSALVDCLLDSALDPLLDEATAKPTADERIAALFDITVCDPACGSGHFLVAAARRIAKRIAAEETGESEPPDPVVRAALRKVVGRCIYGVDINPMAAELAKVSLWMEAMEPGKPLAFLDQNIRVGNSLLGVTPALLAQGLPDSAFKPMQGDDPKVVAALKKQNETEKAGQGDLFSPGGIPVANTVLAKRAAEITNAIPDSLEDLHIHQQRLAQELATSREQRQAKLLADAWCAAFLQLKDEHTRTSAITQALLEGLAGLEGTLEMASAEQEIERLVIQYRLFHWHVEFPHIFRTGEALRGVDKQTGWRGGFTCIIGNPPWERIKLQEKEFFAVRLPAIAKSSSASTRKRMIEELASSEAEEHRRIYREYRDELRLADGWSHLARNSGRYPLAARGDINTYAIFAETMRSIMSQFGRIGCIIPSAIATDTSTKEFFSDLLARQQLISLFEFENKGFFPAIGQGHMNRFCLLTLTGNGKPHETAHFIFRAFSISELANSERRFTLTREDLSLLNPNTRTCPIFRTQRDAELGKKIYRQVPVLVVKSPASNPWYVRFLTLFHMTNDSSHFRTLGDSRIEGAELVGNRLVAPDGTYLPLYEAKMIYQYDHRYGDYGLAHGGKRSHVLPEVTIASHKDPSYSPFPYYWVPKWQVSSRIQDTWRHKWFIGFRDVSDARASARTVIAAIIPFAGISNKLPVIRSKHSPEHLVCLVSCLNSFVLDYAARFKVGGLNLNFFILEQLPVPAPRDFDGEPPWQRGVRLRSWIAQRVLELTYTSWDITDFSHDLGDAGPPFWWDEDRRLVMRAELDAAFFHLYGVDRGDVDYIMETFPVVKRRDFEQYGSYRTKELILQVYDAMAGAARTGRPYQTILDPPPGQGPRHPARAS